MHWFEVSYGDVKEVGVVGKFEFSLIEGGDDSVKRGDKKEEGGDDWLSYLLTQV